MQAAKDTFLRTMADRLAVVNPARTVTLDGASRPAVMAVENETPVPANTFLETFLLSWEGAGRVSPDSPLMYLDCNAELWQQRHGRYVANRSRAHCDRHGC